MVDAAAVYAYNSYSNKDNIPSTATATQNFAPKITITYYSTDPYITLSPASAAILTDNTQTITASYGNVTGTPTITYTSNNTSVATVSGSGTTATVTGVAEGSATITASMTVGGITYTATCDVTVGVPYELASTIESGGKYLVVYGNSTTAAASTTFYAMERNNTSSTSGYLDYGTPLFSDGENHVIAGITPHTSGHSISDFVWTLTSSGDDYTFSATDGINTYYLIETSANDGNLHAYATSNASYNENYTKWTVYSSSNEYFIIHNPYWKSQYTSGTRYYYLYYSTSGFENYYSGTAPASQTGANYRMYLYKKVEKYNITITQATGGTISVSVDGGTATTSSTKATAGQSVTLTADVSSGYALGNWNVTGVTGTANGNTYTFTMPSNDVTVTASYTVSTTCEPSFTDATNNDDYIKQVIITSSASEILNHPTTGSYNAYNDYYDTWNFVVSPGEEINMVIKPQVDGYTQEYGVWIDFDNDGLETADRIAALCGQSPEYTDYNKTYTIPSDVSLGNYRMRIVQDWLTPNANIQDPCAAYKYGEAEDYKMIVVADYAVTTEANPVDGGTVTASVARAKAGQTVTVTTTANTGFQLNNVTTSPSTTVTDNGDGSYSFTMPANNVTVTANYTKIDYTITKVATNGSITVASTANYQDNVSFTVSGNLGYSLSSVTVVGDVSGTTVYSGSTASDSFVMPAENVTITASFTAAVATSLPYTYGFEGSDDWTLLNGTQSNYWTVGTSFGTAATDGGTHALYITNSSGTTGDYGGNYYVTGSSSATREVVFSAKLLDFDAVGSYEFKYDWRANGESSWDYLRVALVPANNSVLPSAGLLASTTGLSNTAVPTGWIEVDGGSQLYNKTSWQQKQLIREISTTGSYWLVFAWVFDGGTQNQPPAAIDNVSVQRAYTITTVASPTGGGTIETSPAMTTAVAGTTVTVEVEAGLNYTIDNVSTLPATTVINNGDGTYSFTMPSSDVTVTATFVSVPCLQPIDLIAGTPGPHGIELSWTDNGSTAPWQICLNDDETNLIPANTNPFTLTGLTAETAYTAKVRANCSGSGNGYSNWSNTVSFTTDIACPAPTVTAVNNITGHEATVTWTGFGESYIVELGTFGSSTTTTVLNEGFEGGSMPAGWDNSTYTAGGTSWNIGTGTGHSSTSISATTAAATGSYNAYYYNSTASSSAYLIMPAMNLANATEATLTFNYVNPAWASGCYSLTIYYRVGGGEWNQLDQYTTSQDTWTEKTVTLSGLDDNYQIAFYVTGYNSDYGHGVGIDDVKVEAEIASITWSEVTDEATSPYTITGLDPETNYAVHVIADCGTDGESDPSNAVSFATDIACPTPVITSITNITGHEATVTWTGGGDIYTVELGTSSVGYSTQTLNLIDEGFEGGRMPAGWTTGDGTTSWQIGAGTQHGGYTSAATGGSNAYCYTGSPYSNSGRLVAPVLNLSGATSATLSFKYINPDWSAGRNSLSIYYRVNGGAWTQIGTTITDYHNEWTNSGNIALSGFDDNYEICFYTTGYSNDYGYGMGIDDVVLTATGSFPTTTYTWTPVTDEATSPYTITGLDPETDYFVHVIADCGTDGESDLSEMETFTTLESCPKPTNVTASNITINSAHIGWNGNADSYNVQYATATITGTTFTPVFEEDFESGLDNWTIYANGYSNSSTNWSQVDVYDFTGDVDGHNNSTYAARSRSYGGGSIGDVSVDNWLVSPQMTLGDVVKFWVMGDAEWPEYYEVLVSTGTNAISDFTLLEAPGHPTTSDTWAEKTVSLGNYVGQQGYIAIRHTDTGKDYLFIDDFGVYNTVNTYSYGTWQTVTPSPTTTSCDITGLSAETLYAVQVQADCGSSDGTSGWSSVYFTTPDACSAPTDLVSSNFTANTATLSWSDNQDSYNVRYREVYFFESFEGETLPAGWTTIDANEDGNTWGIGHATTHSGNNGAANLSFIYNVTGTTPDDYLVSPQLSLQGTLRVWLSGSHEERYDENFAIYVSTTGNTASDFTTTLVGETTTTNGYVEYTADLSGYNGESGYIAIRHFNCTDKFNLYVDDFGLYGSENWVSVTPNPTDATTTLSGLTSETTYEWQVQGINSSCTDGVTDWSASETFTTNTLILDCETEDFSGVTADDDYEATNLPDGWVSFYDNEETSSYGGSYYGYHSHVATNNNYFGNGNNYLLMISNCTNATGSYPAVEYATYAITPYKDVYSFQFKYRYESTSQGTFEFGYVTDNTGYGTWVALDTPTKTTDVTTYTASAADLATIRANNGYVALKYGGVTSGYYFLGVDDIEVCAVEPKLWPDFVTEAPDSWTWDGESSTINITCAEDLAWLISVVNGYNGCTADDLEGKTVNLTTPIMSMLEHVWVPIGYSPSTPFKGTFDGGGNPIIGIHIDYNSNETDYVVAKHGDLMYSGMFGYTENATIKNLSISYGQEGEYHGDTWMSSEQDGGYLGALVAYGKNLDVEFCNVLHVLGVHADLNSVGGIVGYAETTSGNHAIKASSANGHFAITDGMEITNLGGLVGYSNDSVTNCFAMPVNVQLKYTGASDNGTIENKGAVAGYGTKVSNVYVHPLALTEVTEVNGNAQSSRFYTLTGEGFTDATSTFSTAVPRTYGSYSTNNTINGTPLADVLNQKVSEGYKWITPPSTNINMGYPIIVRTDDDAPNAVLSVMDPSDEELTGLNIYVDANDLVPFVALTGGSLYMFADGNIDTDVPSTVDFYIDENAAVTQDDGTTINATVGITFDNSNGTAAESRDWHMFSSTIAAGKIGIEYTQTGPFTQPTSDNDLTFGTDYSLVQNDAAVYFPNGISASNQFDLYSFFEPDYHWINLKRASGNHWHQDNGNPINYTGGDNVDGASFIPGKGYLVALGNNTDANNNFMQAKGVLNSSTITVDVTNTATSYLNGYNFLGNPYQSYLDFEKFVIYGSNASNLWPSGEGTRAFVVYDADANGFLEYISAGGTGFSLGAENVTTQYIHPHQGFFVVKNTTGNSTVTFDNSMRKTGVTAAFRDEAPTYPLVNLHCTDENGKWEHSVIEFDRPEKAGSLKMKGMLNGKCNMYIHWDGEDFRSMFLENTPDYVPVWFDAAEDGVFTMTWNTANANFGYMHLIDNMTGADIDCLISDSYTFESHVDDMSARFRLAFKPLGIEEISTEGENFAFINGNELVVTGEGELSLIDLNGRVLQTQYVTGQQSHITMPKVAVGMYMLRLTKANEVKVQKIVVRK